MPSLVTELTLQQRHWLEENQRTLSEESGSSPPATAESPPGSMDIDERWGIRVDRPSMDNSIFRTRTPAGSEPLSHHNMLPSSSPSWNTHHNEPYASLEPPPDSKLQKRPRLAYPSPGPPPPPHHPLNHPHLSHMHHPHSAFYMGGQQYSHEDQRDDLGQHQTDSPASPVEVDLCPIFPHGGAKLTWKQSYENLLAYKNHYGDCNVPQKYVGNPKLGGWVNKQRKKKKNPVKYGRLTAEHLKLLSDVGFKWE